MNNFFDTDHLPRGSEEVFEEIIRKENVRIERIVSTGQSSAADFWYDQDEHEWLLLLSGNSIIELVDGVTVDLNVGCYYYIPPHLKHRVAFTSEEPPCIWLAVFWK